ncbi:MAG TPA: carboxymuconolactone decarboxylase family protein [Baekduia sp.]|nr:carboxymuconolactone decarboxylase family protein [Baekduia sp.]
MTRIKEAPPEKYVPLFGEDADEFLRILANRPSLAEMLGQVHHTLHSDRILPDRLLELVRLRVAFWNQCRSCMATRMPEGIADGVTEELVCSLERPQEANDLTPAERAAIAYADLMATDHLAIDDQTFEGLREHFSEPEITELAINVAYFVGIGRFAATLHMVEGLPERFRADQPITPWDGAATGRGAASS